VSCSAGIDWRWYIITVGHRRWTRKVARKRAFGDLAYDCCSRPFSAIYRNGAIQQMEGGHYYCRVALLALVDGLAEVNRVDGIVYRGARSA
jgi:hypothetical protein